MTFTSSVREAGRDLLGRDVFLNRFITVSGEVDHVKTRSLDCRCAATAIRAAPRERNHAELLKRLKNSLR
ncbi:hypothetical protein ACT4S2_08690 [Kocuria turfanensis]|uniref:hypothetical protein n=1 Tax=Kocuria turfanensis TaxID=388357 RepID=UPI004035DE29